jgi:hypothetical protein
MSDQDEDYGFSFIDEAEITNVVKDTEATYQDRLAQVERLMIPFLKNLTKDPEKVMIKWPNRASVVQKHMDKLLTITRGE